MPGKHRGRSLGFPTANLTIHKEVKDEEFGVYAVEILLEGEKHQGMANLGEKPTFNEMKPLLEVHIFDFDQDILGKHIEINLIKKIRDTKKLDSAEELVEQLKEDKVITKELLS